MEVYSHLCITGKIKRFSMVHLAPSRTVTCFRQLSVYEAILMQFEPNKVLVSNQLPKGYLLKQNLPNWKQL
jgi:hypothetical protein